MPNINRWWCLWMLLEWFALFILCVASWWAGFLITFYFSKFIHAHSLPLRFRFKWFSCRIFMTSQPTPFFLFCFNDHYFLKFMPNITLTFGTKMKYNSDIFLLSFFFSSNFLTAHTFPLKHCRRWTTACNRLLMNLWLEPKPMCDEWTGRKQWFGGVIFSRLNS